MEARLEALPRPGPRTTFIDEVQRLPGLLNTVQYMLDRPRHELRFLLTGSSARKLRRGEVNLLPGRIHAYRMGPLVSAELDHQLPNETALTYGTLPGILSEQDPHEREKTLRTYASIYLREEIQAESFNGLVANFVASPDRVGMLFEHLVYTQIVHGAAAFDQPVRVSSFRTEHGAEVDLVIERGREITAIETKSSRIVTAADLRGLGRFADYVGRKHRAMVWYLGREPKRLDGIDILPWQRGLAQLGW